MVGIKRVFSRDYIYLKSKDGYRKLKEEHEKISAKISDENKVRLWGATIAVCGAFVAMDASNGDFGKTAWDLLFGGVMANRFARSSIKALKRP